MTHKQAHKIINSSKGISLLCSDWEYKIKDNYVIFVSEMFELNYSVSFNFFMKNILNKVPLNKNKIIGAFRFSSIGFINEDEYFLAQDLIRFERIKKRDLKYGYIYLASNGFKYVYLGITDIKKFNVSTDFKTISRVEPSNFHFFMARLKEDNTIRYISRASSIKLIEEIEYHPDMEELENQVFRRRTYGQELFISKNNFKVNNSNMYHNEFYYIDTDIAPDDKYETTNIYSFRYEEYHIVIINKFRFLRDFIRFVNSDEKEFNLSKYKTDKIYQSSTYHDKIGEDEIPF